MATTIDKAHGRIERRTLRTTSLLTLGDKWKGLKQGYEITRERTVAGVRTIDVAYGMTSRSTDRANANALLDFTRDHGTIETELHSVRDVTLAEDACRVRSGSAPQVLAALRNAMVYLDSKIRAISVPAAIEILQLHPDLAQQLIGIPQCE